MKLNDNKKLSSERLLVVLLLIAVIVGIAVLRNENIALKKELKAKKEYQDELYDKYNEAGKELGYAEYYNELLKKEVNLSDKYNEIMSVTVAEPSVNFGETEYADAVDSDTNIYNNNVGYMNNIQNFGADFTIGYISSEKDIEKCRLILYEIKSISDEICKNAETNSEKAARIGVWVSENIYYNADEAAVGISPDTISLETALAFNTGTCAGYSNIFSALCQAQGIYCVNIRGGADDIGVEPLENFPTNHEWNGVFCDGRWIFYDTTWASFNEYRDKNYIAYEEISTQYLNMDFDTMSSKRRIDKIDFRDFFSSVK